MYAADRKESMMAFVEKRVPDWTNVYEIISTGTFTVLGTIETACKTRCIGCIHRKTD